MSQGLLLEIATCDVRSGSPSGAADFHQAVQPRAPEGAPPPDPEIAQAVLVPILEQPWMPDHARRMELFNRLAVHFVGRHHELSAFLSLLEKQMQLEKKIEAALVHDGVNPINIKNGRHQIRGVVFYPRGTALSERTLNAYFSQIERNGTRQSVPFQRLLRALRNHHINL